MAHVRLVLMARNEALSLPAMAEACRGLIDSWCIVVDPRSTDGTDEVAREAFSYAPGTVHLSQIDPGEWDFAKGRNELLDLASETGIYLMLLDCDSPPVGKLPNELTSPLYICDVHDEVSGSAYVMPVLVASDAGFRYRMPAHEYLDVGATPAVYAPDLYVRRTSTGANRDRMLWTVEKLKAVVDEGGTDAARACMYLAHTYGSLQMRDEAIAAYLRRVEMGGDAEEQFFAMYQMGMWLQGSDPMKASRAFLDAYAMRPSRPEPLYRLAHMANLLGNHELALVLVNQAMSIPPVTDHQFVERWVELWGLTYEWAVAAAALGMPDAPALAARVLSAENVRDDVREEMKKLVAA